MRAKMIRRLALIEMKSAERLKELADHQQRPALAEDLERLRDGAELSVTLHVQHPSLVRKPN